MSLPRGVRGVVGGLLDGIERDFVLGDLEEEYAARLERTGAVRAWVWCWLEVARSVWPLATMGGREEMMRGLLQDLRGGLRVFVREPMFALVVVATLAIGVGGASAVYSVIRGVILSPMEFPNGDRVVTLWGQVPEYPRAPLTVGDYNELARNVESFDVVSAAWSNSALLLGGTRAEEVSLGWVTPTYFQALGVTPALGRLPTEGDENVVVLSHGLWERRYGSDPGTVGRVIDLGGESFEVVGVMPEGVDPNLTSFSGARAKHTLWRLMPTNWIQGEDRSVGWLRASALLRDSVTPAQAQAEVDALFAEVNQRVTDRDGGTDLRVNVVPARADLVGGVSRTLWILLGAVVGVLLVAAANVAHLMLARGEARHGEVAVRAALGGSRTRLVRQFVVESAVLAIVGGMAGVLVAMAGIRALLAMAPATLPRIDQIGMDAGVLFFALGATALTAVVFGCVPALRSTRTDLAKAMTQRASTMDRSSQSLSRTMVVVQVALSLTLVTSTGLLLRSLSNLNGADLGLDPDGVMTFALQAPSWGEGNPGAAAKLQAFASALEDVPGVEAVGFTNRIPLAGGLYTGEFASEDMAANDGKREASFRIVSPGYLEALGARLVAGRTFRVDDPESVVLVDELAAEIAWPGENPVGRRLQVAGVGADPSWAEVVGVVAPIKHAGVAEPAAATVYTPMFPTAAQQNFRYAAVRTSGQPAVLLDAMKAALQTVDPNAVAARERTMQSIVGDHVSTPRFATLLLLVFGVVALALATVGLHGVMAYRVRRRSRELGIRMALGAPRERVIQDAFKQGAGLVLLGIGVGTVTSLLGIGPVLGSMLVEVVPNDPVTLGGAGLVILVAGLLGAYLPARLVLGVDVVETLHDA